MSDEQAPPAASDQVDVIDPQGVLGSVPKAQLQTAIQKYGYKVASPTDVKAFDDKKYYGSTPQQLLTGAEAAGSAASFGLSRELENMTGVTTPEAQAARANENPASRMIGTGVGLVAPLIATGGLAAPEEAASLGAADLLNPVAGLTKAAGMAGEAVAPEAGATLLSKVASSGIKGGTQGAIEGAAFGAGQAVDENALGDHEAMGEKLLHHIGYGALLGGALNSAISMSGAAGEHAIGKIKAKFSPEVAAQANRDEIRAGAQAEAQAPEMEQALAPEVPKSLEDIQNRIKNANYQGINPGELPAKKTLVAARDLVPDMEYPVTGLQLESLSDKRARDYYKGFLESQSDEAKALNSYEALQKGELTQKLSSELRKISPTEELTSDPVKGGEAVVDAFVNQYKKEKEALAPVFQRFDEKGNIPLSHLSTLPETIESSIPGASKYLKVGEKGIEIEPYRSSMPFSKNVHGAIKDLISEANDKNLTLGGLRNVRETMRDRVNMLSPPRDAAHIGSLRKHLMDYMEGAVNELSPDVEMRQAFRGYAINEERRATIEKIFGGSISDRASFAKQIKNEDVLDHLFGNTVAVNAAKEILPPEAFQQALGNWLNYQKAKVTDMAKNGFSSYKFATVLRNKTPELEAALADNPSALARLRAITDIMRILPDSPSINPSGTAKTLNILETVRKIGGFLRPLHAAQEAAGASLEKFATRAEQEHLKNIMNGMMAGKSVEAAEKAANERMQRYSLLKYLTAAKNAVEQKLSSGARSVFSVGEKSAVGAAVLLPNREENKTKSAKNVAMINSLSTNPGRYTEVLSKALGDVASNAPGTAAGVSAVSGRALQYLQANLPPQMPHFPIPDKNPPSMVDLAKFHGALDIVEHPFHLYTHIKNGTLTADHVAGLGTVYPNLYSEMKTAILDHMAKHVSDGKELAYPKRMSLSLFLGTPLDSSLTPQAIQSAQAVHMAAPAPQPKKTTASLGKMSSMYQTPLQARQSDKIAPA